MNREEIIQKLKEKRSFIEREYLNRQIIYDNLYKIKDPSLLDKFHYFKPMRYEIVWGDLRGAIVFNTTNSQDDYLLFSANSSGAAPGQIAIGTEKDGKLYFIRENFPMPGGEVNTILIPDITYFKEKSQGFLPKKYNNHLYGSRNIQDRITDTDIECITLGEQAADRINLVLKQSFFS